MKAIYKFPPSFGIAGGRSSLSYYFLARRRTVCSTGAFDTIPLPLPTHAIESGAGIPITKATPERGSMLAWLSLFAHVLRVQLHTLIYIFLLLHHYPYKNRCQQVTLWEAHMSTGTLQARLEAGQNFQSWTATYPEAPYDIAHRTAPRSFRPSTASACTRCRSRGSIQIYSSGHGFNARLRRAGSIFDAY
jgi:hypothetical protein